MSEQDKIRDHDYDGIQEYDNPMPGWWTWIFILTTVFAVFYVLGVHVFGFINTYERDLAASQEDLQAVRAAHEEANPSVAYDDETIATYVGDPTAIEAGAAHFATYCAVCHGQAGQGMIGPNLTDNYWLHGNTNEDIFRVLTDGVIEKGMAAWEGILTPEQRAQTIAYIRSLEGTNPSNAKEPQGELHE